MKILYGVVGEGMGHAVRSRVVLEHLIAREHEVEVMASGRAFEFLKKRFGDSVVKNIHGMHMIYEENRVRLGKTVISNVLAGAAGIPKNISAYFDVIRQFEPEVVISDFESWAYLFGKNHRLPVLSIDNMQIIHRCTHPPDVLAGYEAQFRLTKAFVRGKLPFCDEYFITTFFEPEIRKPKTSLFPPILRNEILGAKRQVGDHLLVYQTSEDNEPLLYGLRQTGLPCRIYGMRRNLSKVEQDGTLQFMPFSELGFIDDLRTSIGVIASGGFTLMGEAVYLQKPMLSVPLERQFEQVMNARYLERSGYGLFCPVIDTAEPVLRFVERLGEFQKNLASYSQDGNNRLFAAVDAFLDRASAGLV